MMCVVKSTVRQYLKRGKEEVYGVWYVEMQDGERRIFVVRLQSGICQEQEVRMNGAVFGKKWKESQT